MSMPISVGTKTSTPFNRASVRMSGPVPVFATPTRSKGPKAGLSKWRHWRHHTTIGTSSGKMASGSPTPVQLPQIRIEKRILLPPDEKGSRSFSSTIVNGRKVAERGGPRIQADLIMTPGRSQPDSQATPSLAQAADRPGRHRWHERFPYQRAGRSRAQARDDRLRYPHAP